MKSVLISIRPEWVEKIVSGKKTIEVRKTTPDVPFKAYIYCTKGKPYLYRVDDDNNFELTNALRPKTDEYVKYYDEQNGKVIGEFICDNVDKFYCVSVPYQRENNLGYGQFIDNGVYKVDGWHEGIAFERDNRYIDTMLNNNNLKKMCLTAQELFNYIGVGKHLYGLHISNLKIYDKPKELREFNRPCSYAGLCFSCDRAKFTSKGDHVCEAIITRPPQSWQYVEELEDNND